MLAGLDAGDDDQLVYTENAALLNSTNPRARLRAAYPVQVRRGGSGVERGIHRGGLTWSIV